MWSAYPYFLPWKVGVALRLKFRYYTGMKESPRITVFNPFMWLVHQLVELLAAHILAVVGPIVMVALVVSSFFADDAMVGLILVLVALFSPLMFGFWFAITAAFKEARRRGCEGFEFTLYGLWVFLKRGVVYLFVSYLAEFLTMWLLAYHVEIEGHLGMKVTLVFLASFTPLLSSVTFWNGFDPMPLTSKRSSLKAKVHGRS